MAEQRKGKPTGFRPIFVGSGPGADHAAEFFFPVIELLLSEDPVSLPGTVEGELSGWVKELFAKSVQLERHAIREQDIGAVQREVMREAAIGMADPQKKEETLLMSQVGDISSDDTRGILAALQAGDVAGANQIRSQMAESLHEKLVKQMTPEGMRALIAVAARCRAGRAVGLCAALCKTDLVSLIDAAESGNREAVLELIKVDKLFLTDSCTTKVIREAELRNDHSFLAQVARAVTYKPPKGRRLGCRLYLYMLLSLEIPLSNLVLLRLRLDPDGTRFKSAKTFEKFVERTRKEFANTGHCAG